MPELSRPQLLVYGALAVVALLLGARWIRSADSAPASASEPGSFAATATSDTGGGSSPTTQPAAGFESGSGGALVHVAGAVASPGVYRLSGAARVIDAVKRAGGATRGAALDSINLAAKLADGQQVVVPSKVAGGQGTSAASTETAADGPISLGSATVEQLDTIEGIGPVTAQNIIDYRDQQGGLSSVDELDQVNGIGPATMDALRARLQP